MSDPWYSFSAERDSVYASEFQGVVDCAKSLALTCFNALDLALVACPGHSGMIKLDFLNRSDPDLQRLANEHLDEFLEAIETGADLSDFEFVRLLSDGRLDGCVMSCILRDGDGAPVGSIAMLLIPDFVPAPDMTRRAEALAGMLAQLLRSISGKLELELELVAARKRIVWLEKQSRVDQLTGLENSISFESHANVRFGQSEMRKALIILDIDHFKTINDLYGHQFGDGYLRTIAEALRNAFPDTSIVGRLGGDEFGILLDLPEHSRNYLESSMLRCRTSILRSTATLGKPDLGRVSMGAALFPDHGRKFETLFDLADSALYVSKNAGRGVQTVFSPEVHQRFNKREIGRKFREAKSADRIQPHFQPIHDLATGACLGFELLARWQDDQRRLMKQETVTAILSDYRYAEQFTHTMVRQAFEVFETLEWRGNKPPTLAINVTTFDLMNPEFVFEFQSLLSDANGPDWDSIVIEVTESIMLGPRNGQVFRTLEELRLRGARVALDDFGTGYSGLQHLGGWPVDVLKIDRGFIDRMEHSATDGAIVEAIVRLAKRADLAIVAEGIETPNQLRRLVEMNCASGQGFLFSPAVPADHLAEVSRSIDLAALMPTGERADAAPVSVEVSG